MKMTVDLKSKPFYLSDRQVEWVRETIESMNTEEKIGQLFLPLTASEPEKQIEEYDAIGLKPCGVLLRGMPVREIRRHIQTLQDHYKIPLLIAGDLERGSSNMIEEGTEYGHELLVSATNDPELAYTCGKVLGEESAAAGVHWNFGPVCDIDFNPFNPVTNVRTFGSSPEQVMMFARKAAQGMRDGGVLPCAKHFPGDGIDSRDQHFVGSVNSLTVEEWDATYGKVYQALIDDGIESIMTVHIQLPAYTEYFSPGTKEEEILPASLSKELNIRLLREKMGYNGLLITDATTMAGFTEILPRSVAVPSAIAAGADVFLFSRNLGEDFEFMKTGLENGILTEERLDEALQRILGLKAKLHLPEKKAGGRLVPEEDRLSVFKRPIHETLPREVADRGITLVKDTGKQLPMTPEKYPKLLVIPIVTEPNYHTAKTGFTDIFVRNLLEKGFQVTVYEKNPVDGLDIAHCRIFEFREKFDAIIYFMNMATNGSDSSCRISWPGLRITVPTLIQDVPVFMVSIDNPYHLMDAPRIPTYINAYNSSECVIQSLVEKMTGKSEFKGVSPVDAFVKKYFRYTDK